MARFTITPLVFLLVLSAPFANTATGQDLKKEYAKEFFQSFKGEQPNPKDITLFGPDAEKCVKYEADGMRITLPTGYPDKRPDTGMATGFAVHGNFEITLEYEILQEPAPAAAGKSGTHLTLMITLNTPAKNIARFARKAAATGSEYVAWRALSKEVNGPSQIGMKSFATKAKKGRLRLVRTGATLFYFVAEDPEQEFKLLEQHPIREEDLKDVRIFASTGGDQASLDVRVSSLRIRAAAFPATAAMQNKGGGIDQEAKKQYAKDFFQSFKGVQPNPKDMTLFGPDAAQYVKYEVDGLRITLPPGYPEERQNTGVVTGFPVRGDFEITLDYEILDEPAPADAGVNGTRLTLSVTLNTPAKNMATLTRRMAAQGNDYVAWRSISQEPDGPNETAAKIVDTKAKSGRLRLVRSGGTISFFVAEGAGREFGLLYTSSIRQDDLSNVRFFGATGGKNASLAVRVTSLRIRADAFPVTAPILRLAAPKLTERVEYLFHEDITKHPMLRLMGADVGSMASTRPQGLRFNIPAGRNNPGEVGVESRLRLRGDFQITLEYDVLALPDPTPKLGAGAALQVLLDTPDAFKARMGRSRRPVGTVFTANYLILGPDGKEKFHGITAPPANEKVTKGHLRMVRVGKMLSYQIEEGAGFRVIETKEVGLADVIAVQALCATGWQPVALDVQFPRLELRCSELPNQAGEIDPTVPERLEFQFRDGYSKHPMLRLMGPDAESMAVVEPQGLRFNVPVGRANTGEVGIESRLRLRGDFEITLEYELVALPNPPPNLGAGAVLQIVLDTPDAPKARMDRLHRPADAVFGANYIIKDDFRGLAVQPANDKQTKGQLRMVRTGKMLSYQVREGGGGFQEIATCDVGGADVISVQALCATGWQPVALGVRFPRLELRSNKVGGALVVEPVSDVPIAPPSSSGDRSYLWIVLGLGVVFLLIVFVVIVIYLRRRGVRPNAKTGTPVSVSARNPVLFACSRCGKKLKGKPELAGKKIKCPQCGKLVLVAAGEEDEA